MAISFFNEAARIARDQAAQLEAAREMKDWPDTLRTNAVACSLAQHLYWHRREAFQLSAPDWYELDPHTRETWITHAQGILIHLR